MLRPKMDLPYEMKAALAGSVSLGCGIAGAVESYLLRDFGYGFGGPEPYPLWWRIGSYCMILASIVLGLKNLPSRSKPNEPRIMYAFLKSIIDSYFKPIIVIGFSLGFISTMGAMAEFKNYAPLTLMMIIATLFIPHMINYINGQGAAPRTAAREISADSKRADRETEGTPAKLSETTIKTEGQLVAVKTRPDLKESSEAEPTREKPNDQLGILRRLLASTRSRILGEIDALARRGNVNLGIGIFTTFAAIGLLTYLVTATRARDESLAAALIYYVPRISFAVFVEIFSFFFLRLYKACLDGIRYFQNELTNVELRFIAIETALLGEPTQVLGAQLPNWRRLSVIFSSKRERGQ